MRYVILHHVIVEDAHWDFLYERPGEPELQGWALARYPLTVGWSEVRELKPHRLQYLDYQGPVYSAGGSVRRIDQGRVSLLTDRSEEKVLLLAGGSHPGILEAEKRNGQWYCQFSSRSVRNP